MSGPFTQMGHPVRVPLMTEKMKILIYLCSLTFLSCLAICSSNRRWYLAASDR